MWVAYAHPAEDEALDCPLVSCERADRRDPLTDPPERPRDLGYDRGMDPFDRLPDAQRRAIRTVLVVNGGMLAIGGVLALLTALVLTVGDRGAGGLADPHLYLLIAAVSPLWFLGICGFRLGRRMRP